MLPIVQRELRVGARDPRLYKARLRLGLVVILAAALLLLTARAGTPGGFFWILVWLALLFCLLEGVRKTSDSISEERREGTLGFLFLTELNGLDVALGKFAGAFIRSLSGLLAFVPILAVTLLLGGVTPGEFWRSVLVLILSLALSLSLCLALSSLRLERSAGFALAFLAFVCALPPIIAAVFGGKGRMPDPRILSVFSPVGLLAASSDAATLTSSRFFWIGAASQFGMIALALALTSFVTPRLWQEKVSRSPKNLLKPRSEGDEQARQVRRRKLLDQNPILWLSFSERQHRVFSFTFNGVALLLLAISILVSLEFGLSREAAVMPGICVFLLSLILLIHLASQASSNLAEARRNGTLELLLSTPLKVRDIVRGQWLALRKMFLPAAAIIGAFLAYFWIAILQTPAPESIFWTAKSTAELVLEFLVLGWVGMWSGLVAKSPNGAFFRTLLLGLFVPFFLCTPTLFNQAVLIAIAMDKVNVQFRRFVAEKYLQNPAFVLPPPLAQTGAPPVIR